MPTSPETCFSTQELKRLRARFDHLRGEKAEVDREIFCGQPELVSCPIIDMYVTELLDMHQVQGLNFNLFATTLSTLSPKAPREDKCKMALIAMGARPGDSTLQVERFAQFLRHMNPFLSRGESFERANEMLGEELGGMVPLETIALNIYALDYGSVLTVNF